jgi:hypothetical protein
MASQFFRNQDSLTFKANRLEWLEWHDFLPCRIGSVPQRTILAVNADIMFDTSVPIGNRNGLQGIQERKQLLLLCWT